jgi:hypothetical protein
MQALIKIHFATLSANLVDHIRIILVQLYILQLTLIEQQINLLVYLVIGIWPLLCPLTSKHLYNNRHKTLSQRGKIYWPSSIEHHLFSSAKRNPTMKVLYLAKA